ncbi:MAG: hypothetical protein ACE361_16485 [Aureliella sp.]
MAKRRQVTRSTSTLRRQSDPPADAENPYEPTWDCENEGSLASGKRKRLGFRWGVRRVRGWQLVILVLVLYAFFTLVIVPLVG